MVTRRPLELRLAHLNTQEYKEGDRQISWECNSPTPGASGTDLSNADWSELAVSGLGAVSIGYP